MKKYIFILLMLIISGGIVIYTNNQYKQYLNTQKEKYQEYVSSCTENCDDYRDTLTILKKNKYPGNNYETYFHFLSKTNFLIIMILGGILLVIIPEVYTTGKYAKVYPYYLIIPLLFLVMYFVSSSYAYDESKSLISSIPYFISLFLIGYSYYNIGLIVRHVNFIFYKFLTIYGIYTSFLLLSGIISDLFSISLKINKIYTIDNYNSLVNYSTYLYGTIFFAFVTTITTLIFYKVNKIKKF